ncbi:MAG TPA: alpha/beta hydrolase [Candidatus Udaeobacter sp.]|nr:alpha/beta hydrolase [Candidatus Udaeobacter sp.]
MSVSSNKFIFFCLIVANCLGAVRAPAESNTGSSHMVEVGDGVSLRVIEAGKSGDGPALVFIPGWSTGAEIWRHQIDTFAKTHRVIAFDPRSQGESTKTTSGNTPETRAQDLHALLEWLHVQRPVLIGWSQGVQDVAAYVERYGTRDLAGIVLVDAAVSDGSGGMVARPEKTAAQFKMFAVYQAHPKEYLAGMMQAIISKPQSDSAMERLINTGMKTPPDVGVGMLVADMFGVNRTSAIKKIVCPALIIASAKSDELPRQQAAAKQISHARFEKVEDAAHAVFLDQPDRFDELLKSFIASLT